MNRHFLVLAVLSLSTLAASLACSSAPPGDRAPGAVISPPPAAGSDDAAIEPVSPDDASSPAPTPSSGVAADAGPGAPAIAADAALPAPTGTLVAAGSNIEVYGITDDGWIAYSREGMLLVAPLAGGPSVRVTGRATAGVKVSGSAVYTWPVPLLPNFGGDLDVWTSAHQLVLLSDSSFARSPVATSADGQRAAFLARGELMVSNVDGTGALSLGLLCASALAFDGAGDVVSTNCPAALEDAGAEPNLSVFAAPTYARSLLAPETTQALDPTGSWLWISDGAAGGRLVRASDGSVAFRDALATGPAFFDATGTTLFYVSGSALQSLSLASPKSPIPLVASEVRAILALSPDGQQLIYDGYTGIFQQAAVAGAPAAALNWTEPNATYRFTADSADVLITAAGNGPAYYTVQSVAPRATLSRGPAYSVTVLEGTRLLVVDAPDHAQVVDVSGKAPGVELPQMGPFAVSKDRAHLAYVVSGGADAGLYTVSITEGAAGSGSQLH
jgi:hypothetical protein